MTEVGWWDDRQPADHVPVASPGRRLHTDNLSLSYRRIGYETPAVFVEKAVVAKVAPTPTATPVARPTPTAAPPKRVDAPVQRSVPGAVPVYITFYSCPPYCGDPAGPLPLGEGQAACDPSYMGRRFALNGREYVCNDTGNAVWGAHVDLFFWDSGIQGVADPATGWGYLATYGTRGKLTWID